MFENNTSSRSPGRFRCQNLIDLSSLHEPSSQMKPHRNHGQRQWRKTEKFDRSIMRSRCCIYRFFVTIFGIPKTRVLKRPVVQSALIIASNEQCSICRTECSSCHIVVVSLEGLKTIISTRIIATTHGIPKIAQPDFLVLPSSQNVVFVGRTEEHSVNLLLIIRSTLRNEENGYMRFTRFLVRRSQTHTDASLQPLRIRLPTELASRQETAWLCSTTQRGHVITPPRFRS